MNINTSRIIAQEISWIQNNEPTFVIRGNECIGKVGRTSNGKDIQIKIQLPEYYPIMRPNIKVLGNIKHPNIHNGELSLQLLDEWEPHYRLKEVISSIRRLFVRSKSSIKETSSVFEPAESHLEKRIQELQQQINDYDKKILEKKSNQLNNVGVKTIGINSMKISRKLDLECQIDAINDLLDLIELKFEEAELDQVDFFRLYRHYSKERYVNQQELINLGGKTNELQKKERKEPIRN